MKVDFPANVSATGQGKPNPDPAAGACYRGLHAVLGALHRLSLIFPTALQEK